MFTKMTWQAKQSLPASREAGPPGLGGAETGLLVPTRPRPNRKASDETEQALPRPRPDLKASNETEQSPPGPRPDVKSLRGC